MTFTPEYGHLVTKLVAVRGPSTVAQHFRQGIRPSLSELTMLVVMDWRISD